ncbi:MAG: hypothetical protein EA421_01870 [Gemmatimonadales bacterium]|nr:MAG: hypothetical protein EA421_01870 [Gemmatimonadales bacterium]
MGDTAMDNAPRDDTAMGDADTEDSGMGGSGTGDWGEGEAGRRDASTLQTILARTPEDAGGFVQNRTPAVRI